MLLNLEGIAPEDWKYTSLSEVLSRKYTLGEKVKAEGSFLPGFKSILVVNGYAENLSEATETDSSLPFVKLNSQFSPGSLELTLTPDLPVHIVYVTKGNDVSSSPVFSSPRCDVKGEGLLVESFIGEGAYLNCPVTTFEVSPNKRIEHVRIIEEAGDHISAVLSKLNRDSYFSSTVFSFDGKLIRNDVVMTLAGENAFGVLNGLSIGNTSQHIDNNTVIDHQVQNCESRELYKGIYDDNSKGVFGGTIIVRPDAQKTNAIQSNRAILLSDDSTIDSRPQLKIWADDVKCTHGATVGKLDDNALFYLRSRGVPIKLARAMLIKAFASEVKVSNRAISDLIEEKITNKLTK